MYQQCSGDAPTGSDVRESGNGRGGSSSPCEVLLTAAEKTKNSEQEELIEVPPPVPASGTSILAHKLWIGNLDKRLTEQNILRFVVKYGTVVSFRYLFRTGPERAETRDYVFVEFSNREEAERAKENLNGKKALGKKIIVDWAKQDQGAMKNANAVSETWDVTSVSDTLSKKGSTSAKIAALEAKLKQMEEEQSGGNPPPSKKKRQWSSHQQPLIRATAGCSSTVSLMHRNSRQNPTSYRSKIAHRTS